MRCSSARPALEGETARHPLQILVVEDSDDLRHALHTFLRLLDHETKSVGDVTTALQLASQTDFDLLLADIQLPDGTGWNLLRQMQHSAHPPRHAIAMSCHSLDSPLSNSAEAGFDLHLIKPFDPEALEAVLNGSAIIPCKPRFKAVATTTGFSFSSLS